MKFLRTLAIAAAIVIIPASAAMAAPESSNMNVGIAEKPHEDFYKAMEERKEKNSVASEGRQDHQGKGRRDERSHRRKDQQGEGI